MLLIKSKSKGTSITLPWALPPSFDDGELDILIRELGTLPNAQRKLEIRNRIISGHLRLATSIVSKYAKQWPSKVDDYLSEAYHTVVTSVDTLIENNNFQNVTGYINTRVHGQCADLVREFYSVVVPRDVARSGELDQQEYIDPDTLTVIEETPSDFLDMLYKKVAKTPKELLYIQLSARWLTDKEIAQRTGWGRPTIQHIRDALWERWAKFKHENKGKI